MEFSEAISKYTDALRQEIYSNHTDIPLLVTIEAMQTAEKEQFSFGLEGGKTTVCRPSQLQAASYIVPAGEDILGTPSKGATVWLRFTTQKS
jgi:hypothetical protein